MSTLARAASGVLAAIALAAASGCGLVLGIGDVPPLSDAGTPKDGTAMDHVLPSESGKDVVHTDTGGDVHGDAPGPCAACKSDQMCCSNVCVDVMTDNSNCGGCGLMCADCTAGRCVVELAPTPNGAYLTVDSTSVYWTDFGFSAAGTVMSVPIAGGPTVLIAKDQLGPGGIAVSSTHVYWTNNVYPTGYVMRAALAGGSVTTLISGQKSANAIALDPTSVYWIANAAVLSANLDGSGVTTLTSGQTGALALAVNGSSVYFADDTGTTSTVGSEPVSGGSAVLTLASHQKYVKTVAADETNAYWAESPLGGAGTVKKVVHQFGKKSVTLASGQNEPSSVFVDTTDVYWANFAGGEIVKVPIAGGTPTTIVTGRRRPSPITVDATSVYWLEGNGSMGHVVKVTPK